nr:IS110 family transposase [Nocardia coffeae]
MLLVGDDWTSDHHDVELIDKAGKRLAKARQPEGTTGITRLHAIIGEHLGDDPEDTEVGIGMETGRGPSGAALIAAGYAVNPLQAARFRERRSVSGARGPMPLMRTRRPTWSSPTLINCESWPVTAPTRKP